MTDSLVQQKEINGELYGLMPFAIVVCSPISIVGLGFTWFFLGFFEDGFSSGVRALASFSAENVWAWLVLILMMGFLCAFFFGIVIGWPVWALFKKLGLRLHESGIAAGVSCALFLAFPAMLAGSFSDRLASWSIALQILIGALHRWGAAGLVSRQLKKKFGV